jgi:deoxyribonuclease-4
MVCIGFHISISGGFIKAAERARILGCRTMQIFTRSPRGWGFSRPINLNEARFFYSLRKDFGIDPLVVHMPYLPNLASPDKNLYLRSIVTLADELKRAEQLGASYLVLHVGHRGEASEEEAFSRVAAAINQTCCAVPGSTIVLLENTAGQGTEVGSRFNHLAQIIDIVENQDRIGVCLDTAHAWAAGYDLSTSKGIEYTMTEFHKYLGLDRLRLIHLNDSKAARGEGIDRHANIGQGLIGDEGFSFILHHPGLSKRPFIMETPKKSELDDWENMKVVKRLLEEKS